MKCVTVASGAKHVAAATRLRESLTVYAPGLDLAVTTPCCALTRREALKYKPRVILDALLAGSEPVLWLDADCVLRGAIAGQFEPVAGVDVMAYSPRPDYWVDGVLWVANTRETRSLMGAWRDALDNEPWEATDVALSSLLHTMEIFVRDLPPEYCWKEAWGMRERWGNRQIKIEVTE